MGKYLKQGFVRELEWQHSRGEISYSKMVELMEEECIKNYKKEIETFSKCKIKTPQSVKYRVSQYAITFNTKDNG